MTNNVGNRDAVKAKVKASVGNFLGTAIDHLIAMGMNPSATFA